MTTHRAREGLQPEGIPFMYIYTSFYSDRPVSGGILLGREVREWEVQNVPKESCLRHKICKFLLYVCVEDSVSHNTYE